MGKRCASEGCGYSPPRASHDASDAKLVRGTAFRNHSLHSRAKFVDGTGQEKRYSLACSHYDSLSISYSIIKNSKNRLNKRLSLDVQRII